MRANFDAALAHVLRYEGGYVNHPDDPGGETNYGISKRAYPREDIKGMTRERAAAIYKADYWDAVRGDDLPSGLDFCAFDAAVNSGVSRSARWLQLAVGANDDGAIGPLTIKRANEANAINAINAMCMRRLAFLQSLKTWATFGRGWQNRVDSVRKIALEMSNAPAPVASPGFTQAIAAFIKFIISLFKK